jgi:hypothetical protein
VPYSSRDLIGHYVTPPGEDKPCQHACCRDYRVRLEHAPARRLHRAPEADLLAHLRETRSEREAVRIVNEIERRDRAAERKERRQEARRARFAADSMEREAIREYSYVSAEAATRGHMLNRRGEALGVDPRSLFTGPAARARKYASPELLEHWQQHGRPTEAMFAGRDTRVGEDYTDRRGRRRVA